MIFKLSVFGAQPFILQGNATVNSFCLTQIKILIWFSQSLECGNEESFLQTELIKNKQSERETCSLMRFICRHIEGLFVPLAGV